MRMIVGIIALSGLLFASGCQAKPLDSEITLERMPSPMVESLATSTLFPPQGDTHMTPVSSTPANRAPSQLVDQARNDLADRLGIPSDQISVSSVQAVTWPDSSLGCPQEGMFYTQVLTDGYLFVLEANGKTYEYHANRETYVIFCENPSPPVPGMPADR